jgi:alpha-L-rhamnosidase
VIAAGRPGEVFEPRHTTHGFRYVQIDGHPGPIAAEDVTAVVVNSDLAETGWFRCSDERMNALHAAAVWSFRDNACDVPTDCPHRERSGFSGDWQVYVATAALTHDVAGFSDKRLRDLAADQWPDGRIPVISPNPAGAGPAGSPFADAMEGSAGWGDAAVFVPWELWRAYGDKDILERQYASMTAGSTTPPPRPATTATPTGPPPAPIPHPTSGTSGTPEGTSVSGWNPTSSRRPTPPRTTASSPPPTSPAPPSCSPASRRSSGAPTTRTATRCSPPAPGRLAA